MNSWIISKPNFSKFCLVAMQIFVLSCFAFLLIGCAREQQTPDPIKTPIETSFITLTSSASTILPKTPASSPTQQVLPDIFPTLTGIPTPVSTPIKVEPDTRPASEIIDIDKFTSIPLGNQGVNATTLDGKYVYWVDHWNPAGMYRVSFDGGQPEIFVHSLFPDGRLDCFRPISTGKWIIICDTSQSNDLGVWKIRAINLDDATDQTLAYSEENHPKIIYDLDISAQEDLVVWSLLWVEADNTWHNTLTFMNLTTGENRELMNSGIEKSKSVILSFSNRQVVIEQDMAETYGGGSNLYLLDLATETMQALSTNGKSSMPRFVYPWVMWKTNPRFQDDRQIMLYNLQDHRKLLVPPVRGFNSDPFLDGTRVYWNGLQSSGYGPENATYIYEIDKNITYILNSPKGQSRFCLISGEHIACMRSLEPGSAKADVILEWTTIH